MTLNQFIKCFEIERSDGKIFYFNDSNDDIVFKNQIYKSSPLKTKNQKVFSNNAENGGHFDSNFRCGLNNDEINKEDIFLGLYKDAKIESFIIDFQNHNQKFFLHRGFVSSIEILDDDEFVFELKSLPEMLDVKICKKYSINCRADFGDKQCGVDLQKYYYYGYISKINSEKSFIDKNSNFPDGYFENGTIIFFDKNSNKAKYKTKIEFFVNKTFEINFNHSLEIHENMKFLAIPGCNKTIDMCSKRYNNAINFRGEPFIPGFEKIY